MRQIVLVSRSPRRAELLRRIGIPFVQLTPPDDSYPPSGLSPSEFAMFSAIKKLETVPSEHDKIYAAFDTIVYIDGEILLKPAGRASAKMMLERLSGTWHEVFTGIAIKKQDKIFSDFEVTRVKFYKLKEEEIEAYIATGEPFDKAGAYGIQEKGALLVERLDGCYFNVVGLPVGKFVRMLDKFGIKLKELLE